MGDTTMLQLLKSIDEEKLMSKQYQRLSSLLKELFQTNQADLEFGIYRVINQRRDEINQFLEVELLPQVKAAFSEYQAVDKNNLEKRLSEAIKAAKDAGLTNPEDAPRVQEIRGQLENFSVDISDLENQVYADLYNFFRRYYDEGDFISQRRYKEGVYAIPYEGEEVKLHWANHDQYYIKTSEYFRDYSFKLPSGKQAHFKLVEADTEKDNRKEIDENKRRFVLNEEPLDWAEEEVIIRFEFRPDEGNRNQARCNEETLETIWNLRTQTSDQAQKDVLAELAKPIDTNKERTILEKHLEDYTRRNTQDYFIHKDLGKFLRRELDFFIKNEIMHLDNIEHESGPRVEQYLSKIKVIRLIAHKIIDFLAQIENFQKKLWLKKKFVVETNYCITLDRIPKGLYPEIAANDSQREEWVRLFAIDEIKGDLFKVAYSNPLTVDFLKANPFLLVDTKFFDADSKARILSLWDNIDNNVDGVLIQSENFQALRLIREQYKSKIKFIYIDPPYNTKASEILYKNDFKHSSWLSLLSNRINLSRAFLTDNGIACFTIDDFEGDKFKLLLRSIFGSENYLGTVCIRNNPSGRSTPKGISIAHEYAHFFSNSENIQIGRLERTKAQVDRYDEVDEIGRFEWVNFRKHGGTREESSKMYYPIFISEERRSTRVPSMKWDEVKSEWVLLEEILEDEVEVYPLDDNGKERRWKWGVERLLSEIDHTKIDYDQSGNLALYIKSRLPDGGILPNTWWSKKGYSATAYGTNILKNIFGELQIFSYPKSVHAVEDCVRAGNLKNGEMTIDYFAGSGTTGHAVINLNREDDGNRKYILIEMGQYFDAALKPRILKVIYSDDWKSGKPISRKGLSQAIKYLKLESYEDTLNNLELERNTDQQFALDDNPEFRENYILHYMLDFESKGSLLDIDKFDTPFEYVLEIASSAVGETTPTKVDLVETFNYLLGLHVKTIRKIEGVVVVRGITQDDRNIMVLWRTVPAMDADQLDEFFQEHIAGGLEGVADIYVNGDNNLANLRLKNQHWNVHLTEESFHQLMFEDSGV